MPETRILRTIQADLTERGETWVILCPGPSSDRLRLEHLPPGAPVIAVDGGAAHPWIPYQFLASWSRPRAAHKPAEHWARESRPVVLTAWQERVRWVAWLTAYVSRPELPLDPVVIAEQPADVKGEWNYKRLDRGPSWLLAMRVAVERGGAKEIVLAGMDLEGYSYGLGLQDHRRRSSDEWDGRWVGERRMLARVVRMLRKRGIRVRRLKNPGEGLLRAVKGADRISGTDAPG